LLQFKHLLALSTILLVVAISSNMNSAYGHGCQGHGFTCFTPWPTGVLLTYSEVIIIVSVVGLALAVAMLIFKFGYLQCKDFYVAKYHPTSDHINRLLFEGREDKRKIIAAIPFLAFGGLLLAVGLQILITYGYDEYETLAVYAHRHARQPPMPTRHFL
jgi:hypothetical protein